MLRYNEPTDVGHETHFADARNGCGPLLPTSQELRPLRQRLLELLRASGLASRLDLSRDLRVSPASVTTTTGELISLGLVEAVGSSRDMGRGRPPVALAVSPGAHKVAGMKLSDDAHTAVVLDFAGNIVGEASLPSSPHPRSAATILDEVSALFEALLRAADIPRCALSGLGLGLPGLIAHDRGQAIWSPLLSDRSVDLAAMLKARLGLPVTLDNDANLLTLAELWFGRGRAMSNFAMVTIEHGVGMGLVIDNRLFRGGAGFGLELGHTKVVLDGAPCRCGGRGCLEAYVADEALLRAACATLPEFCNETTSARVLVGELFALAQAGNAAARTIFDDAGRYLAVGLANVVQLFDPSLIILSGRQVRFNTLDPDALIAHMRTLTFDVGRTTEVALNAWGDMVWARGAASMALDNLTTHLLGEGRAG